MRTERWTTIWLVPAEKTLDGFRYPFPQPKYYSLLFPFTTWSDNRSTPLSPLYISWFYILNSQLFDIVAMSVVRVLVFCR